MRLNYRTRLLIVMAFLTVTSGSAEYSLTLPTPVYEFGMIKEIAGPKTGKVFIINNGPEETYIRDVRPSCGCTDADFQKGSIAPGDSAWVSFTYNPKGRPGRFEKTVKVYTGEDNLKTSIMICGTVLGTPETLSVRYPVEMGPLRLTDGALDFGTVERGKSRHFFITAYNNIPDSVTVTMKSPKKALDAEFPMNKIAPGDVAAASFYFNSRDVERDGPVDMKVPVYIESEKEPIGNIRVKGKVVSANENKSSAEIPRILCPSTLVSLGDIRAGKTKKFTIEVENTGRAPLRIINAASEDSRIELALPKGEINRGKKLFLQGKLKMGKKDTGIIRSTIDLYTNDPIHPLTEITVTADCK